VDSGKAALMAAELWSRPDKLQWLTDRGLSEDTIIEAQLGYVGEREQRYADCISIPYFDATGNLQSVRYRHLRENARLKYEAPKGDRRHLYNVRATDESVVAICEGEFDSLIVQQLGMAAVGLPGVTAWQRAWRWLFRNTDLVYVLVDHAPQTNPEALRAEVRARQKIAGQLSGVADVEIIDLPEGMDVTDLYLTDPDALRSLLL